MIQLKTSNPSCQFKFPIPAWPRWSVCQQDGELEFNGKLYCAKHYGLLTGDEDRAFLFNLCFDLLDLAEHGDYCNGNTHQGLDEGDVLAHNMINEYRDSLTTIIRKVEGFDS
jgi:hypothetical protein